ncbi:MAG: rRNA maturation RNase YbeY [Candidatus Eremiobacteraeota bacterium]|nr:rRNA maturation RNase YbeY [Candidatus Eremiobacteraeota bacterium]
MIYLSNSTKRRLRVRALERAANELLEAAGEGGASLSLSFVGDRAMRRLNRLHRGKDRATDVLSFPLLDSAARAGASGHPVERLLGDVVISLDTAQRQAGRYDAPLERELLRLLIHGILHVLGHDHERAAERAQMEREERRLARAIGLPWPY